MICYILVRKSLTNQKVLSFGHWLNREVGGSDWKVGMSEPAYMIGGSELKSFFQTRLNRFMII